MVAYRRLGRNEDAVKAGERAIELFGEKWSHLEDEKDVEKKSQAACLYNNLGSIYMERGQFKEARKYLDLSVKAKPDHFDGNWNLGLLDLTTGNLKKGWLGYDWGFKAGERKPRPYYDELEEWKGEDPKGKTIVVWGEQGLGDEILFSSCIKDLYESGANVIFDCHWRLEKIFKRSFPDIQVVGLRKDRDPSKFDKYEIDYHVPIGSLGAFYRNDFKDFPREAYLIPDQERVEYWKGQMKPGFNVGISWRGGSRKTALHKRSIPLQLWKPILKTKGVNFISLQYGGAFEEINDMVKSLGVPIQSFDDAIDDYEETANLVAACDLIISVCTTVIHTGGALGKPVWVMVPAAPAWRYHPPHKMNPWYPNHPARRFQH